MAVIIGFFVLLILGVPIYAVVMMCAAGGVALYTNTDLVVVSQQLFTGLDSTTLLAVPFFIVAGSIASRGKTSENLIKCMNVIFGRLPGGPVIATIATCAFFAAISGSSMATVVAVGTLMIPALKKAGYPELMNVGAVCSGGSLGILIPPSAPMVMFCVAMGTSVGKQFMAGFIPGILLALVWCIYVFIRCSVKKLGTPVRYSAKEAVKIFVEGIPALLFPVIVLGSIYTGWATPTEAAAISTVYVLLIEKFIYRTLKFEEMVEYFYKGIVQAASLLLIIGTATALSYLITVMQIPAMVVSFISGIVTSQAMLILIVMIILFIAGCFMDTIALIVILAPILVPLLNMYGVDLIHFGIMAILASQVGYISPPFGTNLFVTMQVADKPFAFVARSIVPYIIILIITTLVICFIPQISLFLPNLMQM
ncbi:MAG TPA: TRAP transporter large permease [Candidatus Egerieimonas intestinavium]|uniref:TRAP transporter large permease n=1 Tax=Candidatus Egerieimonas intestinavium TaxID=2840777 RepID=A0A9D1EIW9_9FIRM|nr:TRAP transporter large permease [Candidatus Egerieimonas intestinavium]